MKPTKLVVTMPVMLLPSVCCWCGHVRSSNFVLTAIWVFICRLSTMNLTGCALPCLDPARPWTLAQPLSTRTMFTRIGTPMFCLSTKLVYALQHPGETLLALQFRDLQITSTPGTAYRGSKGPDLYSTKACHDHPTIIMGCCIAALGDMMRGCIGFSSR